MPPPGGEWIQYRSLKAAPKALSSRSSRDKFNPIISSGPVGAHQGPSHPGRMVRKLFLNTQNLWRAMSPGWERGWGEEGIS
jgi:hypothetical protein